MMLAYLATDAWPAFSAIFPDDSALMLKAVRDAYRGTPHPIPGTGWTNFHMGRGGCRMHTDRENVGPVTNWTVSGSNLLVLDNVSSGGRRAAVEQSAGLATVFDGNELRHAGSDAPARVVINLYTSKKQLRNAGLQITPAGEWATEE